MDKVYFTWEDFGFAVDTLVYKLRGDGLLSSISRVYGVPRGGLVLAVVLSHRLDVPLVTIEDVVANGKTLVVDDISDSGKTLKRFGPLGVCTATIHVVPGTLFVPDVWALERPKSSWVVYPWEVKNGQAEKS